MVTFPKAKDKSEAPFPSPCRKWRSYNRTAIDWTIQLSKEVGTRCSVLIHTHIYILVRMTWNLVLEDIETLNSTLHVDCICIQSCLWVPDVESGTHTVENQGHLSKSVRIWALVKWYTLDRALQENRGNSIVGLLDEFYSEAETWSEIKALSDTKQVVTQICQEDCNL